MSFIFSVNPRHSPTQDTPFQTPGSTVGGVGGVEEASYEFSGGASGTLPLPQQRLMRQSVFDHSNSLLLLASSNSS